MEVNLKEGIQTLKLQGSILQADAELLEGLLTKIDPTDPYRVIIDFTDATHICSAVLGILVSFKRKFKQNGGDVKLVISDEDLLELFEITMLDKVFEIYSDALAAGRSFLL
ncbi:MAG: STAS domain-containing protein [Leptospira sp.]|nr:STAS domain-containing protein [Leptospira sp.]